MGEFKADIVINNMAQAGPIENVFKLAEERIRAGDFAHNVAHWNSEGRYYAMIHPITGNTVIGASSEVVHGIVARRYRAIRDPKVTVEQFAIRSQELVDKGSAGRVFEDVRAWQVAIEGEVDPKPIGLAASMGYTDEFQQIDIGWSLNRLEP